jgi:hypothetical protein
MDIPTDDIYWGDFVPTERELGVLGNVKGKRILEIGCGGAQRRRAKMRTLGETMQDCVQDALNETAQQVVASA